MEGIEEIVSVVNENHSLEEEWLFRWGWEYT